MAVTAVNLYAYFFSLVSLSVILKGRCEFYIAE